MKKGQTDIKLETKESGSPTKTSQVSLTHRVEMDMRISSTEDKIEEMETSVKENTK